VKKLIGAVMATVVISGIGVAAQDVNGKAKTKISVEEGKDMTLTGCVERSSEGFVLSRAAGKDGAMRTYVLVGEDEDDLREHVGHRVEVKGKAADKGSGKLKIESEAEVESASGDRKKRESKTEVEGDLGGLPFLGVKSIRTLATVCR
jgi:hypothetical protein